MHLCLQVCLPSAQERAPASSGSWTSRGMCVHTCHEETVGVKALQVSDSWASLNINCCWAWSSYWLPIKSARRTLEYIKCGFSILVSRHFSLTCHWQRPLFAVSDSGVGVAKDLSTRISVSLVILRSWHTLVLKRTRNGVPGCKVTWGVSLFLAHKS